MKPLKLILATLCFITVECASAYAIGKIFTSSHNYALFTGVFIIVLFIAINGEVVIWMVKTLKNKTYDPW